MTQKFFHSNNSTPPPAKLPVILPKSKIAYIAWMEILKNFPKTSRYTLGNNIDQHFLNMLAYVYQATYQNPTEKINTIVRAIGQLDMAKFLLSVAWEGKIMANNQYIKISADLDEIGRMLGGWKKGIEKTLETKNSPI